MTTELIERFTPAGNRILLHARTDTNDGAVAQAILGEDEYRLAPLYPLTGWAIDIGAHIGAVAIALAVDNPDLRVVAVEALPENAELAARNVAENGLADRVFVESGAASNNAKPVEISFNYRVVDDVDAGYLSQCRYVGNVFTRAVMSQDGHMPVIDADRVKVPGLTLKAILDRYGIDRVALLKIDCEGCEWTFLRSRSLGRIDRIVGEYHDAFGFSDLKDLLAKTHKAEHWSGNAVGMFEAVAHG